MKQNDTSQNSVFRTKVAFTFGKRGSHVTWLENNKRVGQRR